MTETLAYYNENADNFIEGTLNADMSQVQNKFISDAGCGSGRDSLAFKKELQL